MKVLIAGAGLAGMNAAWRLAGAGHDVTVFEAKTHVGGRTWSHRLDNAVTVERGGEFIHPAQHSIRALCAELCLPLVPHGITFERRENESGARPSVAQVNRVMNSFCTHVTQVTCDGTDISLEGAFSAVLGADFRRDPVYRRVVTSLAAPPDIVSARAIAAKGSGARDEYMEHGGRVLGGNQRITLELAARLGDAVRYEHPVSGVSQTARRVQFSLLDGTRIDGDAAVVAVPLPLLRTLECDFDLPYLLQDALGGLTTGVAAKLSAELSEGAAPRGVQVSDASWWAWNSLGAAGDVSVAAVTAFAGGPETVSALPLDDDGSAWCRSVAALRPDLSLDGPCTLTDWQHDEWTRGAYSQPLVGWKPAFATAFDDAVDHVAFAGEHTAGLLASTMNGAVSSGARAARAIDALADRASV